MEGGGVLDRSDPLPGRWTQAIGGKNGFQTQPVTIARATKGTRWVITPALGSDTKIIAANLDPTFEVTTVKEHVPKVMGSRWRWIGARRFEATIPVGALLAEIYGLQQDQLIEAPDWPCWCAPCMCWRSKRILKVV